MKRLEQFPMEEPERIDGGETSIDTQIEVDLISGGVGFDDGPTENSRWIEELRQKHNSSKGR